MGRFFTFVFPLLFILTSLQAQERYQRKLFDSIEVQSYTYITKNGEDLKLDLYTPSNDTARSRVVVLYVHGGGFSGGSRNSVNNTLFCMNLAQYGYASVSISYRLTRKGEATAFGCDCPATEKMNTFRSAVEDLTDATSFLVSHHRELGIDPHRIILAGSSAGAETILNAAYQPSRHFGTEEIAYAGVISMAGAITDTSHITSATAIPSLFFHGTCDNLVPYASAPHHYCQPSQPGYILLHGAMTISQKLAETGTAYWLHTTCGGAHELSGNPMTTYFNEITEFCYNYVVRGIRETRHTVISGDQNKCSYGQWSFCE